MRKLGEGYLQIKGYIYWEIAIKRDQLECYLGINRKMLKFGNFWRKKGETQIDLKQ